MKKCPSCGKEFEDSMKFCQVDGTPLEDDAPAFDPYATIVSIPVTSSAPPEEAAAPPPDESVAGLTVGSMPIAPPDDILDLPAADDPMKTMMVSESEMKDVLGDAPAPADATETEVPEMPTPPDVITPEVDDAAAVSAAAPPPSPFSTPEPEPLPSSYDEPATVIQPAMDIPFEPPTPVQEWTPPPAPDAQWQNQQVGSNTPFQPPAAGVGAGQNKTLPIVSMVLGILSLCCYTGILTGAAAFITGFLALKNIKKDPDTYGGRGMALAGMIVGGAFVVIWIIYWIVIVVIYGGMIAAGSLR